MRGQTYEFVVHELQHLCDYFTWSVWLLFVRGHITQQTAAVCASCDGN